MSVEMLDNATIINFVDDEEAFNNSINDLFNHLDTNHDGSLSYKEMLKELQSLRVFETHFGIDTKVGSEEVETTYARLFHKFDHDLNGVVDLEEFKAEMKRLLMGVADGIGSLPVQMVLQHDSLLKKAVDRELFANIAIA